MKELSISPGVVTSMDPFRVQILGHDSVGLPCQRVAPAALGARGGVLRVGKQRTWIGVYDTADTAAEVAERVARIVEAQQAQQDALNESSKHAEEMVAAVTERVDDVADEAHDAALAAASASGIMLVPDTDPLPTTRPGGAALSIGDLLYQTAPPVEEGEPRRITGVWIWAGDEWLVYAFAAQHLIAIGSIVGDLIAAETEIVSPTITGGDINGATFRTLAESGGVATRIINGYITFELNGASVGYLTSVNWATSGRGVQLAGRGGPLELGGYSYPTPQRDVNTTWLKIAALDEIEIRTPKNRGASGVGRVEINSDPIGSSGDVFGDTYIGQAGGTDKVYIKGRDVSAVPAMATGTASLSIPGGSSTTGFVTVSLPTGRFDTVPTVVATAGATSGGIADVSVYVSGISTTQFTVRVTCSNTPGSATSCPVRWIAVAE